MSPKCRPSPIARAPIARADAVAARATPREMTHTHTQKNTIARDFAFEMSTSDAGGGRMRICTRATITESVGHQENTRKYDKVIHFFLCACDDTDDDDF